MVPDAAIVRKKARLVQRDEAEKPIVVFEDRAKERADLIIGADGVRSVAREAVVEVDEQKKFAPVYECLCGIGGLVPRRHSKVTSTQPDSHDLPAQRVLRI